MRTELSGELAELRAELAGQAQAVRPAQGERDEARATAKIAEARLQDQQVLQRGFERAARQVVQRLLAERGVEASEKS